jgi:hypothetical protein
MKTIAEVEKNILAITLKITREYPELTKYITEIPIPFSQKNEQQNDLQLFLNYYNSLEKVVTEYAKTHIRKVDEKTYFKGYPYYPASEDIYFQNKEEIDLNPEDVSKKKTSHEKSFSQALSGSDLDIPGAELDDSLEVVGSEDEENNYYSIGGDNHNNLEENNG